MNDNNRFIDLAGAFDKILDSITSTLEDTKEEHGTKTIIRGDRSRPYPDTPAIWVFPEPAQARHATGLQEEWEMNVILTSVVKRADPQEGFNEATRLAAQARSTILKDRTLGHRGFVQDTRSVRFVPSQEQNQRKDFFAAAAVIQVRFRIIEKGGSGSD